MSQWYAIIEKQTGKLCSTGTVIAEVLPAHLEAQPIDAPPSDRIWDEAMRSFKPALPELRPEPIQGGPRVTLGGLLGALSAGQKLQLLLELSKDLDAWKWVTVGAP